MHANVLRYFIEVARQGSIRKASNALNISSSAVNRQLLQLEQELGSALFERLPRGVRLTPAGEVLKQHVNDTLTGFERARSEIGAFRGLKTGHVRISALNSLMTEFLPDAIAAFHHQHPAVTYTLKLTGANDAIEDILTGKADIALAFALRDSRAMHVAAEIETPVGVIMSPSHQLAQEKKLRLADCAKYPLILQPGRLPMRSQLGDELIAAGAGVPPFCETDSIEFVRNAAKRNLGIAFFTQVGFLRELEQGELLHIPLVDRGLGNLRLGAIVPANRRNTIAGEALLTSICEALHDLGRRCQRLAKTTRRDNT